MNKALHAGRRLSGRLQPWGRRLRPWGQRLRPWGMRAAIAVAAGAAVMAAFVAAPGHSTPETTPVTMAVPTAIEKSGGGGEGCLLPAAMMRRGHMDLLRHERRVAVRQGVRDPDKRLERCVTCHAVPDAAGVPVPFDDERHFCRTCHDRVAVSVDCFTCHRSTPVARAVADADAKGSGASP